MDREYGTYRVAIDRVNVENGLSKMSNKSGQKRNRRTSWSLCLFLCHSLCLTGKSNQLHESTAQGI